MYVERLRAVGDAFGEVEGSREVTMEILEVEQIHSAVDTVVKAAAVVVVALMKLPPSVKRV